MSEIPLPEETNNSRLIIGGKAMREIYSIISKYAKFADTILLVGETGVGKDVIAQEIHLLSDRKDKPFKRVSLSALPDTLLESELFGHEKGAFTGADKEKTGIIEAAEGGTLYFPEISDIPHSIQLKLLDFIQYRTFKKVGEDYNKRIKKVDVCLIFATNDIPIESVKENKLREDFYYRIGAFEIFLPPLRERDDEIGILAEYFAKLYGKCILGKEVDITSTAVDMLKQYPWPGNVRELENVLKYSVSCLAEKIIQNNSPVTINSEHIQINSRNMKKDLTKSHVDLFSGWDSIPTYQTEHQKFKKAYFEELIRRTGGNLTEAAKLSGKSYRQLSRILKDIDIK